MRDLEDIILGTMCVKLSEITGIPSGRVLAKMPDIEFVNKYDGSMQPAINPQKFPCIGMQYAGEVDYKVNLYGDTPLVVQNAFFTKVYEPMGEIHIPLYIHLFTNSRKEQRELGNAIMYEMASQLFYYTIDDELPNQYFNIEYSGFKDLDRQRPFERVFIVTLCGQVFREATGYIVEAVITNINTSLGRSYIDVPADQITNTLLGEPLMDSEIFLATGATDDGFSLVTEGDDAVLFPVEDNI
jgi:hypothetical protein